MSLMYGLLSLVIFTAKVSSATVGPCKPLPNTPGWPSASEWQNLNTSVSGRLAAVSPPGAVCHPGQPTYSQASCTAFQSQWVDSSYHSSHPFTTAYNDDTCLPQAAAPCSSAGYPAYAIEAVNVADVQSGVRFATKTGVRLIVKATGHDWPGRSKGPGSLEIWTHLLKGLTLNVQSRTANGTNPIGTLKIAAGMQWVDVYTYAGQNEFTVVGGGDLDVGVGGWILGGGHGPITGFYGLGADQVIELETVTADGEYRVINAASNPDLFWALRGGGGSTFAVMLSVTVKVYAKLSGTAVITHYNTTSNSDTLWSLAARINPHIPKFLADGGMGYYYAVPVNGNPDPSIAGMLITSFIFPQKTRQQAAEISSSMHSDLLGQGWAVDAIHNESTVTEFDNFSNYWLTNPKENVGRDGRLGSWLLDSAAMNTNPSTLATAFKKATQSPQYLIGHLVAPPGGVSAKVTGGGNAVLPAWRKTLVHVVIDRSWTPLDSTAKAAITTELRNSGVPALKQLAPGMGAYLSESDPSNPNWQQDYYGSNYPRLLQIKKQWDPNGVFWCKPCVGNELWNVVDGPSNESSLEWGIGQTPGRICKK